MAADATTGSFDVKHWLKAIGASHYTAAFTGHGLVSYERCINISEDDARAVGMNDDDDVRLLMDRIKELRKLSEEDAVKLLSVSTRNKCTVWICSFFWFTVELVHIQLIHEATTNPLHSLEASRIFNARIGGCGFSREEIHLGISYRFSWHRGMLKISLVGMVTLRSCTVNYSQFCITHIGFKKWPSRCRCASWLPEMHTEAQIDGCLELGGSLLFMNTDKMIGWLIFMNCTARCCCKHSLNHCAGHTASYCGPGVCVFANVINVLLALMNVPSWTFHVVSCAPELDWLRHNYIL